jgi:hypothetical protein
LLSTITGVDEADRAKVVAAFDAAGIKNLADLDDDAKLDAALGKSGLPQGKIDLIKNGLKNARTNAKAPPAAAPTESKTVPSGGVDVQSPVWPTLKAETAAMSTPFQIPQAFTSSPGPNIPFQRVADLQPWQWLHLARSNNLTSAINLNKVLAGEEDIWVDLPAFVWELNFQPHDITEGDTGSVVSATIHQDRFAQSFVTEDSFTASYMLCTASAKASYANASQTDTYSKHIYTRARWLQYRCSIPMENCITLSPLFLHLIEVCFNKISEDDQFDFLTELFNKFGHVVPDRVYLGGVAEYFNELVSIENKSTIKTTADLDAAVKATKAGQTLAGVNLGFKTDGSGSATDAGPSTKPV